jgi:hypothetical protein
MSHIETQIEELRAKREAELDDETKAMLGGIDMTVRTSYTLADAIREGATVSGQAYNWTDAQGNMCAMSAAIVAARSRGYDV